MPPYPFDTSENGLQTPLLSAPDVTSLIHGKNVPQPIKQIAHQQAARCRDGSLTTYKPTPS